MSQTHPTFCRICECLCGLNVEVEGDRVVRIRPNAEHVATRGFACKKGLEQHRLYDSEDRLHYPLERRGEGYARVSWDHALGKIGGKVRQLREDHGPDSIAMYVGTAAGFAMLHPIFAHGFMQGVGSRSFYSSATQDCSNKFAVATHLYGFPFLQPFPDVENIECLIIAGANPAVSKWSFGQVSNPIERIRAIRKRGGRVVVIDPRRTETAKVAGEHVFIRPGTDPFFYLAFLNALIRRDLVDRARVSEHSTGWAEVEALVAPWTPERCAEATGIAPSALEALVERYGQANGAALYSSTGVNMGGHGAISFWLQEVINFVSGNLDRPGGTLVGNGLFDFPKMMKKSGQLVGGKTSRVGGFPSVNDAFPGGLLADEILTPGEGQVRALFVTGGNPLITMANSARLREAFEKLELLVSLDILQGETASMAHYVLPCTSPLQRPDMPFSFPSFLGMQSRPYVQATKAVVPPGPEQRDEATIYVELAKASGVNIFDSRIAQKLLQLGMRWHGADVEGGLPAVPQEAILSLMLRLTGNGGFEKLAREGHGRTRPGANPGRDFLGTRVLTDDGKLHLAAPALMKEAEVLPRWFAEETKRAPGELRLITKRVHTTHNSWTHNHEGLVGGSRNTNFLYLHPDDAAALGIEDGDVVDVSSATATVRVPCRFSEDLMRGVVALPHGWGHQRSRGLSVAKRTQGVNANLLAGDGPSALEHVSGMARLTGIPVSVAPAAGPRATDDWSGISAEERLKTGGASFERMALSKHQE